MRMQSRVSSQSPSSNVSRLQLLLRSTAEVRSEEGHRRYVAYRNLRGE